MGCEKFQMVARDLRQLFVHGRDQLFLVLTEDRPPLLLRFEIHAVFGVEESGGVGAIIRASHLAGNGGRLWERGQCQTRQVRNAHTLGLACAGRQSSAHPQRAFVQMGKELGTDNPA